MNNPEVLSRTDLQRELPDGSGLPPDSAGEDSNRQEYEGSLQQDPMPTADGYQEESSSKRQQEVDSPRRSQRTRRDTTQWTTDFGPASKWKEDTVASVCKILRDSENILDSDWTDLPSSINRVR